MPPARSRYGGHADWYDSWNKPNAERNATGPPLLLGPGDGFCLDVGCGSGCCFAVLPGPGRTVVGLDRAARACTGTQAQGRRIGG
jgi:methylase of polypeptide subunit release factors